MLLPHHGRHCATPMWNERTANGQYMLLSRPIVVAIEWPQCKYHAPVYDIGPCSLLLLSRHTIWNERGACWHQMLLLQPFCCRCYHCATRHLTSCACIRYLVVCHHFHVMLALHEIWNGSAAERLMDANEVGLIISAWAHPRESHWRDGAVCNLVVLLFDFLRVWQVCLCLRPSNY